MRTFGDKPKAFQLEEGGELYYVGSEVYLEAEILALYVYAYFLLTDYRMRPQLNSTQQRTTDAGVWHL